MTEEKDQKKSLNLKLALKKVIILNDILAVPGK
jgi:hypothetical protein